MRADLERVKADAARLEADDVVLGKVAELFRALVDKEVAVGIQAVERLQTEGLRAVFSGQDLRAKATVEVSRGKVSVDLVTVQRHPDGSEIEGVSADSFGGAVSTVQSVLLRVILMLRRNLRPVMFLDETLPALDDTHNVNMGQFLSVLCRRVGVDLLLVTHNPVLADSADRSYRIENKDGAARFVAGRSARQGP